MEVFFEAVLTITTPSTLWCGRYWDCYIFGLLGSERGRVGGGGEGEVGRRKSVLVFGCK